MGNILALLQLLGAALPLIHQLVLFVENAFPSSKQGAAKLDAVVSVVGAVLPTVGATAAQVVQIAAPIKAVVGAIVSIYNATGGVPKSGDAAAPASSEGVSGS